MAFSLPQLFRQQDRPVDPYATPVSTTKRIVIILGILLVVGILLFAGMFFINNANNAIKRDMLVLVARQQALTDLISKSELRISRADLAIVNTHATLLFTSDMQKLGTQFRTLFGLDKVPDDIRAQEAISKTTTTKLDNAALVDKFSTAYRDILVERLDGLLLQLSFVSPQIKDNKTQTYLKKYSDDLETIKRQLAALNL